MTFPGVCGRGKLRRDCAAEYLRSKHETNVDRALPKETDGRMESVEIPMLYQLKQLLHLEPLLDKAGIQHRRVVLNQGASAHRGFHSYLIAVPRRQLRQTACFLKDYYGLGSAKSFTGDCPACGSAVTEQTNCTSCGLNLSGDNSQASEYKELVEFLQEEGLM